MQRDADREQLRKAVWIALLAAMAGFLSESLDGNSGPWLAAAFTGAFLLLIPAAWCALAFWAALRRAAQGFAGFMLGD